MEALKSPFVFCPAIASEPSSSKKAKHERTKATPPSFVVCSVTPDPWTLSDGYAKPKPKSKNPKNPLSDENARRVIKAKARYLSALRRNQGSQAQTPKWIKRTPQQMIHYLEDDRNGHLYGRHVVAAIRRVRSLSGMSQGSYNMRDVMGSFVAKLTFREMCVVLKELKGWIQVRDFFAWMKLQLSYRPSVIVYTIVLRAYGQVGKIKLAEQLFLEMLEAGCEPDEVACGTMLCAYAKWGRNKAMLSFYSAVRGRGITPPIAVYNFMISSLQKKSLHRSVVHLWKEITNGKMGPDHFTYTVIISSFMKEGLTDDALKALNEMRNLGFVPEEATYSLLITFNIRSGCYDEAYELYKDMRSKGLIPSNFTCASLLTLFCKTGEFSKALSLFSEMETCGIPLDEVLYGLLVRIYGKLGLYDDARKTFEEIERLGLLTDEKTYTTMAQVHLRFGSPGEALGLMEKMKSNGMLLSSFALVVTLQCQITVGDLASAEITFQALLETGSPDCGSCNNMINMYVKRNLMDKANDCILQMRKACVKFDEELLKSVMRVYCTEGMLSDARDLIDELSSDELFEKSAFLQTFFLAMRDRGSTGAEIAFQTLDQPDPFAVELILILLLAEKTVPEKDADIKLLMENANGLLVASQLISKLSKEGDVSKAEYLYKLLLKLGGKPEVSASVSLISLYVKHQKLNDAKKVFAATTLSHSQRTTLYNSLIEAYSRCGKQEEAFLFYKEEIKQGYNLGPVAMSMLVNALVKCGKYYEAEDAIKNSLNANIDLDTVAYNTFIKAMLEAGKLQFAAAIYEHMMSQSVIPSIYTYNIMISVYGRGRNLHMALEMFNLAQSKGMSLDEKTYTNIICYLGKAVPHSPCPPYILVFLSHQSMEIVAEISQQHKFFWKRNPPLVLLLNTAHLGADCPGKTHEALRLFREMQEKGMQPGKVSCSIMMKVCASAGLYSEAEELYQIMKQDGYSPGPTTFLDLIRANTKGLRYGEAEKVLVLMEEEGISPSCAHINLLMVAYTRAGLLGEAERMYRKAARAGLTPDLDCNRIMLRCYMECGHVQEGISFFEKISESVEPDKFTMSAAIHLYKCAGMELKAAGILRSMSSLGIPFLKDLEVGSKTRF